jgi:hypothetical protein
VRWPSGPPLLVPGAMFVIPLGGTSPDSTPTGRKSLTCSFTSKIAVTRFSAHSIE